MKKLLLALVVLGLTALTATAQVDNWGIIGYGIGTSTPTSCTGQPLFYYNTSTGNLTFCDPVAKAMKNIPVTVNSTGTLTVPAGVVFTGPPTPGTAATTGNAETLTNKTLTAPVVNNPVISGPTPVACTATCSPTAGQLSTCSVSTGCTATIPTATGNVIRFQILTTNAASGGEKVLLTTVTDTIIGTAVGENSGTAKVFVGNAGTYHSL